MRNKTLLLNYVFIIGIATLFVNDQLLKFQFSNFITGKLSDVCGIVIFTLLLTYVFPKLKAHSVWIAALLFSFWKSGYSQSLINLYNQYSPIETSRIIDYSDLWVLLLLPIPYCLIKNEKLLASISIRTLNPNLILIPTIFILVATSPPRSYHYTLSRGNLKCHDCHMTVNYSDKHILTSLEQNGIKFDTITTVYRKGVIDSTEGIKRLFKRELIIDKDTLRNIDITIRPLRRNKTKIYFNGLDTSEKITEDELRITLRKYYKRLIFNELKNKL